jgi:glycosyltransferase involved in cell wall biosynthesis
MNYLKLLRKIAEEKHVKVIWLLNATKSQLEEVLANADVYIHTSLDEPFGISMAEAALAGLPVIVPSTTEFYRDVCKGHDLPGC